MSLLKTCALWTLAIGLALVVLYRWRRGRRAMLSGTWSPRVVRAVAVLLVTLGAGRESAEAGEPDDLCITPAKADAASGGPTIGPAPPKGAIKATGKALDVVPATKPPKALAASAGAIGQRALSRRRGGGMWLRFAQNLAAMDAARTPDEGKVAYEAALAKVTGAMLVNDGLPKVQAWMARELPRMQHEGAVVSLVELRGLVDAAEADHLYNSGLVGWIWRRAAVVAGKTQLSAAERVSLGDLYARLRAHVRVEVARTMALAAVGPIKIRPWMSKAARPQGYRDAMLPATFPAELDKAWKKADAGPWDTEATLRFVVASAPRTAVLHRQGQRLGVEAKRPLELRRLDLLEVPSSAKEPVVLEHPRLGVVMVKPGHTLTSQNVPALLGADAKAKVEAWAVAAGRCERDAQLKVQAMLPAAAPSLRRVLTSDPKGAPALRMILQMYEN